MTVEPEFLTVKDVQTRLNVSKGLAWTLIRAGEIPHVRIHRCVRVQRKALEAWIEQRLAEYKS
jgi:excisionase family DNA binding protein